MNPTYYMQRARAAHAAAEAATDPLDKAAYRGAARTWEKLANPSAEPAFTLNPYVRELAIIKRDAADALSAQPAQPQTAPTVQLPPPPDLTQPTDFWRAPREPRKFVDTSVAVAIDF